VGVFILFADHDVAAESFNEKNPPGRVFGLVFVGHLFYNLLFGR
jgi:hypothetical protein